jgi:hypothetical protein
VTRRVILSEAKGLTKIVGSGMKQTKHSSHLQSYSANIDIGLDVKGMTIDLRSKQIYI